MDGIPKLKKLGLKTKRPQDYFAEMLKTDDHMKRVEENLNHKRQVLENSEKAKKLREMKKMGKQIQHEVLLNRQKEKKQMLEKVKQYKKGKMNSLYDLDGITSNSNNNSSKNQSPKGILKKNSKNITGKRAKKNDMYGYGGKKKFSKRNDAESYADDIPGDRSSGHKNKGSLFGRKKNSKVFNTKKGQKIQRPGKNRRQKMRGKK